MLNKQATREKKLLKKVVLVPFDTCKYTNPANDVRNLCMHTHKIRKGPSCPLKKGHSFVHKTTLWRAKLMALAKGPIKLGIQRVELVLFF